MVGVKVGVAGRCAPRAVSAAGPTPTPTPTPTQARTYQKLGRWGNAQRAAARVVEGTATYSPWERGQPRMLAVGLGSAAALELGDGKKALAFFSTVLKYDPDQVATHPAPAPTPTPNPHPYPYPVPLTRAPTPTRRVHSLPLPYSYP